VKYRMRPLAAIENFMVQISSALARVSRASIPCGLRPLTKTSQFRNLR
jgi:hypothetical protein